MKTIRELFSGLFSAIASGVIVLAAMSLAAAEGMTFVPAAPQPPTATAARLPGASQPEPPALTTPTAFPTIFAATPVEPTATTCAFPAGWIAYIIQAGDTVEALASANDMKVDRLIQANCLWSNNLPIGSVLYLPPPKPTATMTLTPFMPSATTIFQPTVAPCGAPYGWVRHVVQAGETLFQLSLRYGISLYDLQMANCLGSSVYIQVGQVLYVPNVQPVWPTATRTFTLAPTWTRTPVPPTKKPPTAVPTTAVPTTVVPTTAVPSATPVTPAPPTATPVTPEPATATPVTPAPPTETSAPPEPATATPVTPSPN